MRTRNIDLTCCKMPRLPLTMRELLTMLQHLLLGRHQ